jgi:hypothetical protein
MTFIFEEPLLPANPQFFGGRAGNGQIYEAGRDAAIYADNASASAAALEKAYDDRIAAIAAATGAHLENPFRLPTPNQFDSRPEAQQPGAARFETHAAVFDQERARLLKQFPQAADAIAVDRSVESDAQDIGRKAAERYARFMSTRTDRLGKWSSALAGGFSGSLRDPLQVATLALGAGPGAARTVGGAIVKGFLKEALVNGVAEAILQPKVQAWHKEIGLPSGFDEAVRNVLFAAGFAGVLGGVLGGAGKAFTKLMGAELDVAAKSVADSLPDGHAVKRALEGDGAAAAEVLKSYPDLPPAVRGAAEAVETDAAVRAVRPAEVPVAVHDAKMRDALRFAEGADYTPEYRPRDIPIAGLGVSADGQNAAARLARAENGKPAVAQVVAEDGAISSAEAERALASAQFDTSQVPGDVAAVMRAVSPESEARAFDVHTRQHLEADIAARETTAKLIQNRNGGGKFVESEPVSAQIVSFGHFQYAAKPAFDAETAAMKGQLAEIETRIAAGEPNPQVLPMLRKRREDAIAAGQSSGNTGKLPPPEPARPAIPEGGVDDVAAPEVATLTDTILRETLEQDGERVVMLSGLDDAGRTISKGMNFTAALAEANRPGHLATAVLGCRVI